MSEVEAAIRFVRPVQCGGVGLDELRRAGGGFSGLKCGNQVWELHDVEDAPQIVGERGQAKLRAPSPTLASETHPGSSIA